MQCTEGFSGLHTTMHIKLISVQNHFWILKGLHNKLLLSYAGVLRLMIIEP